MDAPDPGLCACCRFVRRQHNQRGSDFVRCGLAEQDPAYRRYPPLPVLECDGFEARPERPHGPLDPGGRRGVR